MTECTIIERYGGHTKEEPLTCLEAEAIAPNTCVMEADSPFFGYYNEVPSISKPRYLYYILSGYPSFESITRATHNIRKQFHKSFDAAPGTITVYGTTYQVIRIRNLQHYNDIATLQNLYLQEGIMMKKKTKKIRHAMAMIKLRKFFCLEPLNHGMYFDHVQPHHGYFMIPDQIDWEYFKQITLEVKYDPEFFHFDGAICFIYECGEAKDMIRIYRENITPEELKAIRDKYYKVMRF
ncbi:MAG: hypothetical protein U1C46_02175 [Bacteroidales bacterium]|nr:hypothetical protein [Bacteroidales bacterium]MDZ4203602.1 hypothetical protein [Bacteroidales bacterium]